MLPKDRHIKLLSFFVILCGVLVECQRKTKKKVGRKVSNPEQLWTGVYFCLGALALMFVPLIGYFIYNIYRDPDLPKLTRELFGVMKRKTLSYLSADKKKAAEAKTT